MISCFDEFDTFLFWLQPIAQQHVPMEPQSGLAAGGERVNHLHHHHHHQG